MAEHNEKKIRVAQIISAPRMGGIENQLLFLLQRYDRDRFEMDVICTVSLEGTLKDKYKETGTRLMECRWSRYIFPYMWRLLWLLRREKYDVLHTRTSMVSGPAILLSKLAGIPVRIASYHNVKAQWRHPGLLNRLVVGILQKMTRKWATKILSVSRANLDYFFPDWRLHSEKFGLCYNGIDLNRFSQKIDAKEIKRRLGLPVDSKVVGIVGTLRKQKNHDTFIKVAERLSKQFEDVYYLLIGDGPLRGELEREVENRGLSGRFIFAGTRNDIPHMLATMDIFLMPSLYEGFGTVAIEAQICGVPVVGSDLPCIREALYKGLHKFLCDPLDVKGMAEYVALLLRSPQLRDELGEKSKEFVRERFSIDKTVKHLESLYSM